MSGETCFDRIAYMLTKIGIKTDVTVRKVLVVARDLTPTIKTMFDWQTYPAKTLMPERDVTEAIKAKFDILAVFDPQKDYDKFYLEDKINAFKYTECDFVTEGTDRAYSYVQNVADEARTVVWRGGLSLRGVTVG